MARWGMVIDLRKCIGCDICTVACRQTNNGSSGSSWRRIENCEIGDSPKEQRVFLPMSCMHCSKPPCLEVCPTTATYRRPDGIVDINHELCVGCGYCIVACPFLARSIMPHDEFYFEAGAIRQESVMSDPDPDLGGVCTKCDFCLRRVEAGLAQGLKPGLDAEASPACVIFCPAKAMYFGDLNDPGSVVSRLIQQNNAVRLQEELGTDPSVYHIVGDTPLTPQGITETELIQPKKQKVWGWPAVASFILGGTAAGIYLISLAMASLQGAPLGVSQPVIFKWLAPVLTGLGFLALTVEVGRPLRSYKLLRHLRRSWMSREALAGAIFVPAAVLDWLFPHPALSLLAAAAAMLLMISQGFILYWAQAVTAWNVPLMPLLFISSGFATGGGLVLLLAALDRSAPGPGPAVIVLIWVVVDLAVWLLYLYWSQDAAFRAATKVLRRPKALVLTVGVGHLLPALLLLLLLVGPRVGAGAELRPIAAALAGLTVLTGGASQKTGIILEAGYLRGIVLGRPKSVA